MLTSSRIAGASKRLGDSNLCIIPGKILKDCPSVKICSVSTLGVQQDIEDATDEFSENAEEILPRFNPDAQPENTVLVRMTRDNFRYDIIGFTFTKEHPFIAMTEEDAQKIFDKEEGFRIATPKEVQEYYA